MDYENINHKKVIKAVRSFVHRAHIRSLSYSSLSDAVEKEGYTIIEYLPYANASEVEDLINALELDNQTMSSDGFTYVDKDFRLIFIKSSLNEKEKCIVLSHEMGHIMCHHFGSVNILGNSVTQEREASLFSSYLLNYNKINKYIFISIITLFVTSRFTTRKKSVTPPHNLTN